MPTIPGLPAAPAVANAALLVVDQSATTQNASRAQVLSAANTENIVLQSAGKTVGLDSTGNFQFSVGASLVFEVSPSGASVQYVSAGNSCNVNLAAGSLFEVTLAAGGTPFFVNSTGAAYLATLWLGSTYGATTLGTVIGAYPVSDGTGTVVGYVPLYDSIT